MKKLRVFCSFLTFLGVMGLGIVILGRGISKIDENMTTIYVFSAIAFAGFAVMGLSGVWELLLFKLKPRIKGRQEGDSSNP